MKTRKPLAIACILFVALAALLPTPWVPAAAQGGPPTCGDIGCGGGARKCAEIAFALVGTLIEETFGASTVEVTLFCYEPPAS